MMKSERYKGFSGWIVLMEGEHRKENESVIADGKDLKIKGGGGEVVKLVGRIGDGEGIICGKNAGLRLEGVKMKEIEGDYMNVPLIVWSGGYLSMSGIEIIRIGGGGESTVVMEVSESRASEIRECIIKYEWKNSSSLGERYVKNEEGEGSICEWNESVIA